jgi:type IV pilus assembly protein PilO
MNLQQAIAELQTLDAQNPGGWPTWVRIAASILAAVVIMLLGLWFMIKPQYELLQQAKEKEISLRSEFERKQKKVAALDAYKAQLAEMEKSFGDMLRQLPSKTEVANLLNDISQTRVASSLEEELFQPQPEIPKDFYAEIPNKIVVVGNYHEVGTFVSGVAALPRIVTIDEVEIKPAVQGNVRGKEKEALLPTDLRVTALAKTYRYLDDEEVAAAEAAKAPAKGGRK